MLDPRGDTGVYLLYAFVRINSVINKSKYGAPEDLAKSKAEGAQFKITNDIEKELALTVLRLPEQLDLAVNNLQVKQICEHTYDMATKISEFWQKCKVHNSEEELSRILLLDTCRKVMAKSFDLLGIKTIDKI